MYSLAVEDGTCVIKLKPLLPHGYQLRAYAFLNLDRLEDTALDYEKAVAAEKKLEEKNRKHVKRKVEKKGLRIPNLWTHEERRGGEDSESEKSQEEKSGDENDPDDVSSSISSLGGSRSKKRVTFLEQAGNVPVETIPSAKIMLVSVIASLGSRCITAGQHARAVEYLKRTQELAPLDFENWVVNSQLAQSYLSLGDGENALSYARKVIKLKQEDPQGYYMSGEALLTLNRHVEAAESFETAVSLNPKYGEAKRKLAQARALAKEVKKES